MTSSCGGGGEEDKSLYVLTIKLQASHSMATPSTSKGEKRRDTGGKLVKRGRNPNPK